MNEDPVHRYNMENLTRACMHICVIAQDLEMDKKDFLHTLDKTWDKVDSVEDKVGFVAAMKRQALEKLMDVMKEAGE